MSEWDDYFEQLIDAVDNLRAVHFKVAANNQVAHDLSPKDDSNMVSLVSTLRDQLSALKLENNQLKIENRHLQQQFEMLSVALENQTASVPPTDNPIPTNHDLHFPDITTLPQPSMNCQRIH